MDAEFPYWHMVSPEPNSGCWLWDGPVNWCGYGRVTIAPRKRVRAHRLSYEWHKGPIPAGMILLHKCDIPSCVNPDHLRPGTQAENMKDMWQKGRQAKGPKLSAIRKLTAPRGEAARMSKLTEAQAFAILHDPRSGSVIGAEYGIMQQHVSRIKRGERWSHLQAKPQ